MSTFWNSIAGTGVSWYKSIMNSSWFSFQLRFSPIMSSDARNWASKKLAWKAFQDALRTVPAYKDFIQKSRAKIKVFTDIPPMDKDHYIKKYSMVDTLRDGKMPEHEGVQLDQSSGSTGQPTTWVRGESERHSTATLMKYAAKAAFGDTPFVLINAFALGSWATGTTVHSALVDHTTVLSTGPDIDKIKQTLINLGSDKQFVIAGYPPFLKLLADSMLCDLNHSVNWSTYKMVAVVGGEGMSENLRSHLQQLFKPTLSSYGASDLAINIGYETEFEIELRHLLIDNEALRKELYGANESSVPMIFHYDPLNFYIEVDKDRNLLFTDLNYRISPRIRYNLHDHGLVMPVDTVVKAMHKCRLNLKHQPRTNLPLIFVWGRIDFAVAFFGSKTTPEQVRDAIDQIPTIKEQMVNFAMHTYEDSNHDTRLDFWFELKQDCKVDQPEQETWRNQLIQQLRKSSQDFDKSCSMVQSSSTYNNDSRLPNIRLFAYQTGPFVQDIRLKRQYVFTGNQPY